MNKSEFINLCKKEFLDQGFTKIKGNYYLLGKDLLCGINLQKSNYGNIYYINYYYCIGDYNNTIELPTYYDSDIQGRFFVMSKTLLEQGEAFQTSMIEYEEYTEKELDIILKKELKEKVLPPIKEGKKYILDNLRKIYFLTLRPEEVMRKLNTKPDNGSLIDKIE